MNPMTEQTARAIVAQMVAETPKPARVALMKLAIKTGNLSESAKAVYTAQLKNEESTQ